MGRRARTRAALAEASTRRGTEEALLLSKLRLLGVTLLCAKVLLVPLVFDPGLDMPFPVPKALLSHGIAYLLAGVMAGLFLRFGQSFFVWTWLHVPVLAFLLVSALATFFAADKNLALFGTHARMLGLGTIADGVVLYFGVVLLVRSRIEATALVASVLAASAVVLGYEAIQAAGRDPFQWAFDTAASPLSTLGQPTTLAHYLTVLAVGAFVTGVLVRDLPNAVRVALLLYGLALFVGSVATGTRSTVLGVATGGAFLVLTVVLRRATRRVRVISAFGALAASAVLAIGVIVSPIGARLTSTIQLSTGSDGDDTALVELDPSSENRITLYTIALRMVMERPILGYGPDNFAVGVPSYRPQQIDPSLRSGVFSSAHSWVAHVTTGSGLIGLVAFLALVGLALALALRQSVPALGRASGAMLAAFLGAGLTTVNDITTDQLLWVLIGTIGAATAWQGRATPVVPSGRRPRVTRPRGRSVANAWPAMLCLAASLVPLVSTWSALDASRKIHLSADARLTRRLPEATDLGLQATRLDSGRAEYWHKLGLAYAGAARWREASSAFERASSLARHDIRYLTDQVTAQLLLASGGDTGARTRALDLADQAVRIDPNNPRAHLTRATTQQSQGTLAEALASVERALALDPASTNLSLYVSATQIYLDLGRPSDAVRVAREGRAVLGVTTTAALGFELARALFAAGQAREALAELDLVLSIQPNYPAAVRLRTQIQAAVGN
jgi:O-antigen ligase/cytochrome c-type biogenesis protein CcmH/NrfG